MTARWTKASDYKTQWPPTPKQEDFAEPVYQQIRVKPQDLWRVARHTIMVDVLKPKTRP